MSTPEEHAGAKLLAAAYLRWEQMPPVLLTFNRMDLYAMIIAFQTMITHPGAPPMMKRQWEHMGRQLQEWLCDDPELYAMTEAGWNRAFDVEREDKPEPSREAEGQRAGAGAQRRFCEGCGSRIVCAVHPSLATCEPTLKGE